MCCGTEAGSFLRRIDACVTQLKAQGPSRTCNESKEEEEKASRGELLGGREARGWFFRRAAERLGAGIIPQVVLVQRVEGGLRQGGERSGDAQLQ